MGAGRKTVTLTVPEKNQMQWTVNWSVSARNLRKSDLGGVIFGCKNVTIQECFLKQLFGLPAPHYSYIKNITPELPLFLFNYSDRRLHGIFEAACYGQLNVDPHAWAEDESDSSPYPAQVKFRTRLHCEPLVEEKFHKIIAENYFDGRHFWFELDHHQTKKLISLFSFSPVSSSSLHHTQIRNNSINCLPASSSRGEREGNSGNRTTMPSEGHSWDGIDSSREERRLGTLKDNEEAKIDSGHALSSIPHKSWSGLFKKEADEDSGEEVKTADFHHGEEECNLQTKSAWISPPLDTESDHVEAFSSLECSLHPDKEITEEVEHGENSLVPAFGGTTMLSEMSTFNLHSIIEKLSLELEELKSSQSTQEHKIYSLEQDLDGSRHEIQHLKFRCNMLESRLFTGLLGEEESEPHSEFVDDVHPKLNELIVIAGGFDGSQWLSSLDSYSLYDDLTSSLAEMSYTKAHYTTAKLNSEVYIIGGASGNLWCDTVERYNSVKNCWTSLPSLNQRKGSLAAVPLDEKIFTVGGGDGNECFSAVEMLDRNVGKWIQTSSMLHKRFATAAAGINGVLYAVGGYDGDKYLRSVERLDPREHSWTSLGDMNVKRGCHSLVVLNEKLFALGGFNGESMVSSVEEYDPRVGWIMVESMNICRGYFGAAVVGDEIYALGGVDNEGVILETVECYKIGHGWHKTGLKGFGKRSFFSLVQ